MIVTFKRQPEREDDDIKRFFAAHVDGERVPLAVIKWSKAFSKRARAVYAFSFDEDDLFLRAVKDHVLEQVRSELLKTGNPTRLVIELPEAINEAA